MRLVELEPPTLEDARSDLERFDEALGGVEVPLKVLTCLPKTLRDGHWRVVATLYGKRVVDVHAVDHQPPELYGAAVDIGTSKIIVYLFDLAPRRLIDQEALENPQMRFGEDVVTRIAHAIAGSSTELPCPACARASTGLGSLYERQGIQPETSTT